MTPLSHLLEASIEDVRRRQMAHTLNPDLAEEPKPVPPFDGGPAFPSSEEPEQPATAEPQPPLAWMKLFHRSGLDVRLPIPVDGCPVSLTTFAAVLQSVDNAIAAGWMTQAPGLEAGENRDKIAWVSRCLVPSRNGGECSRIFLYLDNDACTYKHVAEYLNTPDDVAAFEYASGLKLEQIPVWPTKAAPKRLEKGTAQYIIQAPRPFEVIWKLNPDYQEGVQGQKEEKRLFVRWANSKPPAVSSEPAKPPPDFPPLPGVEPPPWWETRQFAVKAADERELADVIDKLDDDVRASNNGDRAWLGWLIGFSLHRLIFYAERQQDLVRTWSCVNVLKDRMPAGWVDVLNAYKDQRKQEVKP
jgi:hypothetical protein